MKNDSIILSFKSEMGDSLISIEKDIEDGSVNWELVEMIKKR